MKYYRVTEIIRSHYLRFVWGDFFLTMVNHHQNPTIWENIFWNFPKHGMSSKFKNAMPYLGGGFKYVWNFHPYLGKIPILTSIFFRWVVQPSTRNESSFGYFRDLEVRTFCQDMHQCVANCDKILPIFKHFFWGLHLPNTSKKSEELSLGMNPKCPPQSYPTPVIRG